MRTLFLAIFLSGLGLPALAQQFGGNPSSVKWKQIDSDTARIIYPAGLDSLAYKVAALVHQLAASDVNSLGKKGKKIDIVLQNQPVVTNGYVGLGPFRSEFYTMPSADNFDPSSLSWLRQLTVHEYRHVQQYNNFHNGLSALMKILFGQEGYAMAINAAVPDWFFEGDAVYAETILAPHGRGTLPYFLKAYPALWQAGKNYSWAKLRNGSLKDYVPNHYDLGYLLVNYGTEKYGYDFWQKVTRDASAYKGLIYPMQKAVKRYSGQSYRQFRDSAFHYYKDIYEPATPDTTLNILPVDEKTLTHYFFPYQVSADSLLYLKTSNNKRQGFYVLTGGREHLIRLRDISIDEQFGYRNGKIVYAAYESHPRWRWVSYSVLRILDIKTGQQRSLHPRTRYFSPDISANGQYIAANKVDLEGHSSLVILNAENGDLVKEVQHDSVAYFANPKWLNDSTIITVLRNKNASTCIGRVSLVSGTIENLTPPSPTIIGTLYAENDKVYFTAAQKRKDELFRLDISEGQVFKMSSPGVGSYFIHHHGEKTIWSSFTADGYQLQQKTDNWQPFSMADFISSSNGIVSGDLQTDISTASLIHYPSRKYPKLTRPVHIHSWRPNYADPEFSFTVYGNNILNTTETQLYYLYNENDKTHTTGGSLVYGGLFPHITVGSDFTFNRKSTIDNKTRTWNEWNTYAGLSIPLSWASKRSYKSFNIGSSYYYRSDFNKGEHQNNFRELHFSYLSHRIGWSQQVQSTVQDIFPRLGYSSSLQFRHALNTYQSSQGIGALNLYLPGIIRNHSTVLNTAFQYTGTRQRVFGNRIALARGVTTKDSAGVWASRANYHFPLFYPDWGFGNIFYLRRVRANLFFDHMLLFNREASKKTSYQSTGAEIYLDTQWWNQYPLSFGFRVGQRLGPYTDRKPFFEFVLPTSLIPR